MVKGWFIGAFSPTVFDTSTAEIAIKTYKAGDSEDRHHHKIATEVTAFIEGSARMNGVEYGKGEIVVIRPGESTDFCALTDLTTVVVKIPGALNDKYPGNP
jgi:hypothetical protein